MQRMNSKKPIRFFNRSINRKVTGMLLLIGFFTSLAASFLYYHTTYQAIHRDALAKAEMISNFALAVRVYTVKKMRPLAIQIAGKDAFHPELMGGFFVAREVADIFGKKFEGYSFKQATPNPINYKNLADSEESQWISRFDRDHKLLKLSGITQKEDRKYFYMASPIVAKQECLRCHSTPSNAPAGRVEKYPGKGGYGYRLNQVIAAFITYVPIEQALADLRMATLRTMAIGIGSVLVMVAAIWLFMRRIVTGPIIKLARITNEISRGKDINQKITTTVQGEIGELYRSFDRLRISVIKLLKLSKSVQERLNKQRAKKVG